MWNGDTDYIWDVLICTRCLLDAIFLLPSHWFSIYLRIFFSFFLNDELIFRTENPDPFDLCWPLRVVSTALLTTGRFWNAF